MGKSPNKLSEIIAHTIVFAAFFGVVFCSVTGKKISSNPFVWVGYGIGGWVITFVFLGLMSLIRKTVSSIRQKISETKAAKEPCPHSVVGGRTRLKHMLGGGSHLKCGQCNRDEIEFQRKEQAELLRREAAGKIRAAADKLQADEYMRLTKLRTHKIDYLLRLSPGEFEEIVGDMYRQFGYSVERTPMDKRFWKGFNP
ncbi:MAG: hypothetical protein WDM80_15510 [Limisphaerales bacterium]